LEEPTEPPEAASGAVAAPVYMSEPGAQAVAARVSFDFIEQFMEMINELQAHPRIANVEFELGPPVPPFAFETMAHGLGMEIPPVLRSIYELADGVELTWTWHDDAGAVCPGGRISLCDFSTMFGTWFDVLWEHRTDMDEEALDVLWSLRGFESLPMPSGRRQITGVALSEATAHDPALFIYEPGKVMTRMLCGVVDYLYAMLAARGVYGWQVLLSEYDFVGDPWGLGAPDWFFHVVEVMFPETELELWRQRLPEGS
jgi:hypothetical protein